MMNIAEAVLYALCFIMAGICVYLYLQMKDDWK